MTAFLFRPRFLLFLALVVSSTVVVPLISRCLPDLSERAEYRLKTSEIEVVELPRWVPQDLVVQVIERAGLPEEMSVLESDLTERLAEAFRLHPWVVEVVRVKKTVPAGVEVQLKYRRPVAMVQVKQGAYPVDVEGVLLPPADFSVADTKRYPLIGNIVSTPQGPAGTHWGDIGVTGGARVAEVLAESWRELNLAAIRAPRPKAANTSLEELRFELITEGGSQIIWGRPPGTQHPGELTPEQKIGRLKEYLSDFGSFENPHGPYEIDIRHWQEISRRPIQPQRVGSLP